MTVSRKKNIPRNVTGSRERIEPEFLAIGKIRRRHGIEGEWLMDVLTDFPERIRIGKKIFIGDEHIRASIQTVRNTNKGMLIRIESEEILDQEENWGNKIAYTDVKTLPNLQTDQFYHHQIIGMKVIDEEIGEIGSISTILETGANDVYVVVSEGKPELLLPAINSVIRKIDINTNSMIVRKPEWI